MLADIFIPKIPVQHDVWYVGSSWHGSVKCCWVMIARYVSFVTCCHTLVIPLGDVTANQKLAAFLSCHVTVM